MTNGEKLQKIFPNLEYEILSRTVLTNIDNEAWFSLDWWNSEYKEPTTKNDLGVDYTPNTISFDDMMDNLKMTAEDIENAENLEYSIEPLIHPKNDLGVDCISRQAVVDMTGLSEWFDSSDSYNEFVFALGKLPSVTPQEPQSFKWCRNCKEYDQDKHCCHRWSKVIRDTVEEMKQEQESRKGYLSIDDVMSVFDDFMCGEVDEEGIETFWEMLKDKAESEDKEKPKSCSTCRSYKGHAGHCEICHEMSMYKEVEE